MKTMKWNVWYHDFNKHEIRSLDIFNHYSFYKDTLDNLASCKNKEDFAEKLNSDLRYYFWSRAEYEIILGPWCGSAEERKIDIYQQIMLNKEQFIDYVWSFKKGE